MLKALLDAGFLHGDCLTVTGKTLAENLKDVPSIYSKPQNVVVPLDKPLHANGAHRRSCTATWPRTAQSPRSPA